MSMTHAEAELVSAAAAAKWKRPRGAEADRQIATVGRLYEKKLAKKLADDLALQAEKDKASHLASVHAEEKAGDLFDELIPDYLVWSRDGLSATEKGYYTWINPKSIGTLQVFMPFVALDYPKAWVEWSYWDGNKFVAADDAETAIGELYVHKYPPITEAQIKVLIYGPF
jgi:hypothetical protein